MLFHVSLSGIFGLQDWFCSWKCFAHAKLRTNIQMFWPSEKYHIHFILYVFISGCLSFSKRFIYLFACAGSLSLLALFSSCSKQGLLIIVVDGLLIVVASFVAEHKLWTRKLQQLWQLGSVVVTFRLQSTGSVVGEHRLGCSTIC